MNKQTAIQTILNAGSYFEKQSAGYKSWGKVTVLQIALRTDENEFLISSPTKSITSLTEKDITVLQSDSYIAEIFSKKKKIQAILITKQEYASQIKEEIPPILDDQAQLLGVSVRVAKNEKKILSSLCSRYAAILPNGDSICLGIHIDDAYVAAQLLEKTSKAFVEAKYLGGAKSINRIEAWLMQQFYQLKYSKEAKKNK